MAHNLRFSTYLDVEPEKAWGWITSFAGINTELKPYVTMSAPKGVQSIDDVEIQFGKPLFRSWLKLFGIMPIDYSNLTLVELKAGEGFLERSSMGSMKIWQHERKILPEGNGVLIIDELMFESRLPSVVALPIVKMLFKNRHKKLDEYFNGVN